MNTENFWEMFGKMAYEAECRNCPVLKYKQDNYLGICSDSCANEIRKVYEQILEDED
jgi:hypothetical protein